MKCFLQNEFFCQNEIFRGEFFLQSDTFFLQNEFFKQFFTELNFFKDDANVFFANK